MIRATLKIKGSAKGMAKEFRGLVKDGLFWLIEKWHEGTLEKHFEPAAKRRYKYEPRSIRYLRYKRKKKPQAGLLEFSGRSKKTLTRAVRISGTSKKATGAMNAPPYFSMKREGHPDMVSEVTAVTKHEAGKMARALNERVTKGLNEVKDVKVVR